MPYSTEVLEKLGPVVATGLQTFPRFIRDDLTELRRAENRATAERLITTSRYANFQMYCLRALQVDENLIRNLTIAEIAKALTCSETVASTHLNRPRFCAAPKRAAAQP